MALYCSFAKSERSNSSRPLFFQREKLLYVACFAKSKRSIAKGRSFFKEWKIKLLYVALLAKSKRVNHFFALFAKSKRVNCSFRKEQWASRSTLLFLLFFKRAKIKSLLVALFWWAKKSKDRIALGCSFWWSKKSVERMSECLTLTTVLVRFQIIKHHNKIATSFNDIPAHYVNECPTKKDLRKNVSYVCGTVHIISVNSFTPAARMGRALYNR